MGNKNTKGNDKSCTTGCEAGSTNKKVNPAQTSGKPQQWSNTGSKQTSAVNPATGKPWTTVEQQQKAAASASNKNNRV